MYALYIVILTNVDIMKPSPNITNLFIFPSIEAKAVTIKEYAISKKLGISKFV
ncbi:MAG: hypothetical protein LBC68_04475 [Prevotellaceae bacterium]|jgi:hypothetical protein|nr:hypothetical protein [Prevotellaceae bacterium]